MTDKKLFTSSLEVHTARKMEFSFPKYSVRIKMPHHPKGWWGKEYVQFWAANFTKLETLHICDTEVTDLSWLKDIRGLKWLEISDSPICDLSMLRDHINIRILRLARTNINDISFIENYQRLDWLVLVECPIDDYFPLFRLQSRLKFMELDENTAKKIDLDKLRKQHLCIDIQIYPKIKTWLW